MIDSDDHRSIFDRVQAFLVQLRRRHVFRTTGLYLLGLWLASQGLADLFPAFGLPDWTVRAVVIGGLLATPLVALISWRYEFTAKGIEVDPGQDSDTTLMTGGGDHGSVLAAWIDAEDERRRRRFATRFTIGRKGDVVLQDRRVSRQHAEVYFNDGRWQVRDLHSANGTYLGGARIRVADLPPKATLRCHQHGPEVHLEISEEDRPDGAAT